MLEKFQLAVDRVGIQTKVCEVDAENGGATDVRANAPVRVSDIFARD